MTSMPGCSAIERHPGGDGMGAEPQREAAKAKQVPLPGVALPTLRPTKPGRRS
jgi:hypothetical protein